MTSLERINAAMDLKEPDRVPVAPFLDTFPARVAGITLADYLFNFEKFEKAYEEAYLKLGKVDMIDIAPMGLMYLDPFPGMFSTFYFEWCLPGRELQPDRMAEINEHAKENPIMDENGYDLIINEGLYRFLNFKRGSLLDIAKIPEFGMKSAMLKAKWMEKYQAPPMIEGQAATPFDLLNKLRGTTNFLLDLHRRPEKIIEACDWMVDGLVAIALNMIEMAKAEYILCGSVVLTADFVSPKTFEKFGLPYLKKVINGVKDEVKRIQCHFDTNWTPLLEYLRELPSKKCYLHLDERTDIFKAKEILGDHMCLFGNVKPSLLSFGTPKEVEKEVKKIIDGCAEGGGLIVSAEVPDDAKFENVKAMVDATKKYGVYRK
jgi:hypothetical protein